MGHYVYLMSRNNDHWSVNYEGGKIIEHALMSPLCKGYSNIQISMDAPFLGRVADTSTRRAAPGMRAETAFPGYDENIMINALTGALAGIQETARTSSTLSPHEFYVFQIARGKAAKSTEHDILAPILKRLAIANYEVAYGYRSDTYFQYPTQEFIFVNIGMMACLTQALPPGQLCIPETTHDVMVKDGNMIVTKSRMHHDDLLSPAGFTATHLFGIADDMPFVTPENYPDGATAFTDLVSSLNI